MKNKITAITEKVPQTAILPDGMYHGVWGGYMIEITTQRKTYQLTTELGVRGMGIKVIVEIKNGVATFDEVKNIKF